MGAAASQCHRTAVAGSGIVPTLAHIMLNNPYHLTHMQQVGVEFLQCALLAEHYRYASRLIADSWPRPNGTVNVKQVLRYFYLRGMIHLGCQDIVMAHRCFWTCLSIPAEINSKIMIEAWKKLVLVQCLQTDASSPAASDPGKKITARLPKSMPNCLGRLLASYKEAGNAPMGGKNKGASSSGRGPAAVAQQQHQQQQHKLAAIGVTCYMDLVAAFHGSDKAKMESVQQQYQANFQFDGNWGLVQQCHTKLVQNQVVRLSKLYSVVPLTKCAEILQLPSVEQVTKALCQSHVPCEIQDDGMVEFMENSGTAAESKMESLVDLSEWIHLLQNVQTLDIGISTSPKYHALARKELSGMEGKDVGPRGVDDF